MKINKIKTKKVKNVIGKGKRITRIYLVWNIDNVPYKVYIGKEKSHQNKSRKDDHIRTYGRCIFFDYIDKCNGWNKKDWKLLETKWIKWFKEQGYKVVNKNNGGGGAEFCSEEHKIKISKANFGRSINKAIPRPKNIRKYIGIGNKGKKFNDKIKKHLSKIRIGKKNITVKKPVIQYDLNMNFIKEYISLSEAARSLGVVTNNISACCLGNQKTCCGFIFKLK